MHHETRGYAADVLAVSEVHLRDEERGRVAAAVLLHASDSLAVREFVDALPLAARQDLADYLESGSMAGRHWAWREPLLMRGHQPDYCLLCAQLHYPGECFCGQAEGAANG